MIGVVVVMMMKASPWRLDRDDEDDERQWWERELLLGFLESSLCLRSRSAVWLAHAPLKTLEGDDGSMVIVNDHDNDLESFHGDGDYHGDDDYFDSNDDDQPWLALQMNPLGDHDDY